MRFATIAVRHAGEDEGTKRIRMRRVRMRTSSMRMMRMSRISTMRMMLLMLMLMPLVFVMPVLHTSTVTSRYSSIQQGQVGFNDAQNDCTWNDYVAEYARFWAPSVFWVSTGDH